MARFSLKISRRDIRAREAHQQATNIMLPANIEIEVDADTWKKELLLTVTEGGLFNLGDPSEPKIQRIEKLEQALRDILEVIYSEECMFEQKCWEPGDWREHDIHHPQCPLRRARDMLTNG